MLATLNDVLPAARAGRYAVPAFDCVEDVMIRAVIETCEEHRTPAIIMGLPGPDLDGNGWYYVPGLVRAVADRHGVPVVIHLDHATKLDDIRRAVDIGFTSVMIDGSALPLAENMAITRAAVEIAHPQGVTVEAELGKVGGAELEGARFAANILTEPKEVEKFVAETDVDALAVSIGTSHGVYRSLPRLDIGRLAELNAASKPPLVLHGGSGTPIDQLQQAVRSGITKLNIYADNRQAMVRGLLESARTFKRTDPLPRDIFGPIRRQIAAVVKEKINVLFAANRVTGAAPARGGAEQAPRHGGQARPLKTRKLVAISDKYIPLDVMRDGLAGLKDVGVSVEVRKWEHDTLVELQQANLSIEQGGAEAVKLPPDVTADLAGVEMLVVQFAPVGTALIDAARDLKVIAVLRGGVENVAVEAATRRGIAVLNTPGRNARAVAECALGMILAEVRNLARSHEKLMHGTWTRNYPNKDGIPELCGKTVGLVGYGSVARLVAGYLEALGSRVIACDPFVKGSAAPAAMVDLPTLMRDSDVISVHARLTKETEKLIGRKELAMMKPTAVLVNTARSGLIDEPALVEALRQKRIMGAALDVFDVEPLPEGSGLLKLDNVTLTPHLAGSTIDAFRNSPKMAAGHLARMLKGETDLPVVNGVKPRMHEANRKEDIR
jgi:D-3-phosphoglycerate dehydrogenase